MQVTILLATYNAQRFIEEQLNSILDQSFSDWNLIIYDDGSNDETLSIINTYVNRYPDKIKLIGNNNRYGSALGSFSFLLTVSNSQYTMFCDQDDIWQVDKIEKTLKKMKELEGKFGNVSLLVHSDLEVVDVDLQTIDRSFWNLEQIDPSINQINRLLMQNTITGCTVMINKNLAQLATPIPDEARMHDRWLGLVASKFGKIDYVDEALIKYRQHAQNSIGANGSGIDYIINKIFTSMNLMPHQEQAKAFLEIYRESLDGETIEMLEEFTSLESKSFWQKRKILLKYKILKQGFLRNLGLMLKI